MRILYFGLPLGAHVLAQNGVIPSAICLGHPDAPGARRMRRTLARDPKLLLLGAPDLHEAQIVHMLRSVNADAILSWFWPFKIPRELLALVNGNAYGVHPSLLPRWRGRDPYFWALRSGDRETGVTLHRLEAEYDTGEIIESEKLSILPTDNSWSLAKRLDRPSLRLLVSAGQRLQRGEALRGSAQPKIGVTLAPRPDDEDLVIDFHATTNAVLDLIRAAAPEPGASALIEDVYVSVLDAAASHAKIPRVLAPGEAFIDEEGVHVITRDGAITLKRVRTEDDEVLVRTGIAKLLAK